MHPDTAETRSFKRISHAPRDNIILCSLPDVEYACLHEHSTTISLEAQQALYGPGKAFDYVYFPDRGVISLLITGSDGSAVKTAVVGREGIAGSTVVLGVAEPDVQAIVQIGGQAMRVPTSFFLQCYRELPNLNVLINQHIGLLLFQARQYALCHALHSLDARLCQWLLQTSDSIESNVIELTQDACSHLLGVQRTSVSMAAHFVQTAGGIRTRRGKIEILDRGKLERAACECYAKVKERFQSAKRAALPTV